jgi:hypothetical protein
MGILPMMNEMVLTTISFIHTPAQKNAGGRKWYGRQQEE